MVVVRTYVGAEPSGLFGVAQHAEVGRRRSFRRESRRRRHEQTLVGAYVETGYGYVVHAHPVRYHVVAVQVADVRVTDGGRPAARGHGTGRHVLEYAARPNVPGPAAADRTVVNAFVELDALDGGRHDDGSRPVDGRDDVLLVRAVVGAHGPTATAPQPLAEPGQRRARKRRHPGHAVSGFRYETFNVRHGTCQTKSAAVAAAVTILLLCG